MRLMQGNGFKKHIRRAATSLSIGQDAVVASSKTVEDGTVEDGQRASVAPLNLKANSDPPNTLQMNLNVDDPVVCYSRIYCSETFLNFCDLGQSTAITSES